jgi:hypothetical protein
MDRVTFLRAQAEQFRELAARPMNIALREDFLALARRCDALADQIAESGTPEQ